MLRPSVVPLPVDFMERWAGWYADVPPVGFLLRDSCDDRWLRIHSLPASKRYATSGWEWAELLRRHNAVANDVLGEGAPCAALICDACDRNEFGELGVQAGLTEDSLPRVAQLPPKLWDEEKGIFAGPMCVFGAATTWRPGAFDDFISAVAEERTSGLLVEFARGQVYAPYDGGADLFFATPTERDAARERFGSWLSSRPDGL